MRQQHFSTIHYYVTVYGVSPNLQGCCRNIWSKNRQYLVEVYAFRMFIAKKHLSRNNNQTDL